DSQGKFLLETPADVPKLTLAVNAQRVEGNVVVETPPHDPTKVTVNIEIDPNTQTLQATQVNARAGIVGMCASAFKHTKIIKQGNGIADGTVCIAKVTLRANGRSLRG